MPRRRDTNYCHFCAKAAIGAFLLTNNAPRPETMKAERWLPLCSGHFDVLYAAGNRGRIHQATGLRWRMLKPYTYPKNGPAR